MMATASRYAAQRPLVCFVIVNWNGRDVLRRCLEAIRETSDNIIQEVIVVDNGSTDGSTDLVCEEFPMVKLITLERNYYFAYPNNLAAKMASGEHLFLLNNDVVLHHGCVSRLLSVLESNERVGAVAPQLLYPDGRIQPSCRRLPTFANLLLSGLRLDNILPRRSWKMRDWDHTTPRYVEQPMMAALLVRGDCWRNVGELDERFALYFNDVDWCRRALDLGWKIRFEPSAQATHEEAWTGKKLGVRQAVLSAKGLYRYFRKHNVKSIVSWRWPVLALLVCGLMSLWSVGRLLSARKKTKG